MTNHELLDLIGEAGEDYVQAADSGAARPRFGWKGWAACAACAALALGVWSVYRAANPPLHSYTVMEGGGGIADTRAEAKVPVDGADIPMTVPDSGPGVGADGAGGPVPDFVPDYDPRIEDGLTDKGGEPAIGEQGGGGSRMDGAWYGPAQDAPVQEEAQARYQGLLRGLGGQNGYEPETYPDWFGGAWIDNDYYPEAKLAVAVVDGFRTADLEAQVQEWCGGEVVFRDVKYSQEYLYALLDRAVDAVTGAGDGLSCGVGTDLMENCLGVDLYSDRDIPRQVLAELARLDPAGDAIRVRVFTGALSAADDVVKGPAPEPAAYAVPGGARAEPFIGKQEEAERLKEADQAAVYDEYDAVFEEER